jgi:DnaJ-class molecular chaperone
MKETCPYCKGEKTILTPTENVIDDCPMCNGTGFITK